VPVGPGVYQARVPPIDAALREPVLHQPFISSASF
jgi:hypothetical protein